jgi:hypothetical protein
MKLVFGPGIERSRTMITDDPARRGLVASATKRSNFTPISHRHDHGNCCIASKYNQPTA